MELLVAMMAGALGGALLRGRMPLMLATGLGIAAGTGAWYLLVLIGPGPQAGPILTVHATAGAALGAAVLLGTGQARRRLGQ